jgi:sensor domain CHASE-containing protein
MSSAERLALERAKRQLDCARQQMTGALNITTAVMEGLQGALDSDDASRAHAQETFRRNAQAQREGDGR